MSFESDLARLEAIIGELERDELALDHALRLFAEGVETLRSAGTALAAAESEVKRLVERSEGVFDLDPFRA